MLKIQGLEKFQKDLKNLANKARDLDGSHEIPMQDLLNRTFLQKYTRVSSFTELVEKSGFDVKSEADLKAVPDDAWDSYIRSISSFPNWDAMLSKAGELWVTKKLGF
jgi:hypothetical protein